ncbi:MAG: hypothetical protein PHE21_00865 [Candidatus Dojkabacteria bacterium]|nr:hypothetical protein [Candidatus Dojkabacteria bacterium]
MNKKNVFRYTIIPFLLFLIVCIAVSPFAFKSKAAALAAAYVYLSRIEADIDGSTATVEIVIALDTSQSIGSGGTVTLQFPDADDGKWCRTAGTLTVAGVTASAADQPSSNWDIDAVLPTSSSLAATCAQGSGSSSYDKITISNVGALTAGTTYGVKITNGTAAGVIGTDDTAGTHTVSLEAKNGTTIDVSSFDLRLIADDTVVVSASVSAIPSVNCVISSNTADLGTLYPGGSYLEATHTITATTSSTADGYYWAVYGTGDGSTYAGLYYSGGPYLIPSDGTAGRVNLTAIESEGFGLTASAPSGATVASDFATGTAGEYGELGLGVDNAKLLLYQGSAETGGDQSTITYGARASSAALAGSYTESVIFVCGGYY